MILYVNPCLWTTDCCLLHTQLKHPIYKTNLSFEQACMQAARDLHSKGKINVMWSGGVDSSHVLACFLLQNLPVTVTYTERSEMEFPELHKQLMHDSRVTMRLCEQAGQTEIQDFILADYINVYGDPEVHIKSTLNNQVMLDPAFKASDEYCNWRKKYDSTQRDVIEQELLMSGVAPYINSTADFKLWLQEYNNLYDNYVEIACPDQYKQVVPFYADYCIQAAARSDIRFWQQDCRVYKYIQKALIYKLCPDKQYYLHKDKRGSAGNYRHRSKRVYLILDDFTAVTDYKQAVEILNEYRNQTNYNQVS